MATFNIVELIENNPITKLSTTYQNKLLTKIKTKFTETEQQLFVASFYSFLNYNSKTDYVVDLDDVWKWVGYSQKIKATLLLEKNFVKDKDYILLTQPVKQSLNTRGGHNKETFMLNITTFKKFCLKAGTKKADEIHDYYIKLEETLQELVQEESSELKMQLDIKDKELDKLETHVEKIRERTLMDYFGPNVQCVYYGIVDDVSETNEKLIKFGNSNNLRNRVLQHKDTYTNFRLLNAFKVENKMQIENEMKEHPLFAQRQRTIRLKGKKYIELLSMKELTYTILDQTIKEIIKSVECSADNFKKILEENKRLKKEIVNHNQFNNMNELVLLRGENKQLKIENLKLLKCSKKCLPEPEVPVHMVFTDLVTDTNTSTNTSTKTITEMEVENYGIVMNTLKRKRRDKSADGMFHIDGNVYEMLEGSRAEVWNGKAYQTAGGLIKNELIINIYGKIVSKNKSIDGQNNNKFKILKQQNNQVCISNPEL
jgi:phage anti-repressor protein